MRSPARTHNRLETSGEQTSSQSITRRGPYIAIKLQNIPIIAAGALALAIGAGVQDASATAFTYQLRGQTTSKLNIKSIIHRIPAQFNKAVAMATVNYDNVEIYGERNDDGSGFVAMKGFLDVCIGRHKGGECIEKGDLHRYQVKGHKYNGNGILIGNGEFKLHEEGKNKVQFKLDPTRSTSIENLYANADSNIGYATIQNQKLTGNEAQGKNIRLGLKQHPELKYAWRLFDTGGGDEGEFSIYQWQTLTSWLFGAPIRYESRPGEAVFNGNLVACAPGATSVACGGSTEIQSR